MFPAPVWARHRVAPARTKPRNRQTAKPQNLRFISDLQFLLRAQLTAGFSVRIGSLERALLGSKRPSHGRTGHGRTGEGREAGFTPLFLLPDRRVRSTRTNPTRKNRNPLKYNRRNSAGKRENRLNESAVQLPG